MKITRALAAIIASGLLPLACAADLKDSPPPEKARKAPEWTALFGDASLPVIWQSAVAASEKIATALAEKKVEGIPDWAETIHLASHALQAQAKVEDADRQADVIDAFRLSARIADDVTAAAWTDDVAKANEAYQRMKLALAIAERNLPKEIVSASAQVARFAKKQRRAAADKK